MPPESRKKLYDAVSIKFDIGSFDEFNKKMDDAASRKKFYDSVSNDFDLGDFNTFEGKISLKKKAQSVASATGGFGSQLGSQTFQPTKAFVPTPLVGTGVEDFQKQEARRQVAAEKLSNKLKGQQAAYYAGQGEQGFVDVENAKLQSDYNQLQTVIQKDLGNKGNDFTITYNKLLQGTGSMISGGIDAGLNALRYAQPMSPFVTDATILDYRTNIAPGVKSFLKDTIGADVDKGAERKYDEDFITGAIGGLAYSVPAMVTPFGIGLYSQAYDSGLDLINSTTAGQGLTEAEKTLFAGTLGAVMGRLEKVGLDRTLGRTLSSELANGLAFKAINELSKKGGAKITSKAIGDFAEASLRKTKNRLLNSADQGYRAFLDEFTTGGLQEVATIGAEQAVNKLKNKDIFDTQDMGEMFGRVLKSAAAEGVGGAILGTAKGGLLVNTKNHITSKISKAKSFDDVRNLLLDVERIGQENNYSPEEVQGVVDTVNDIVEKKQRLPQDLTPAQTTGIVSLMIDRDELTDNLKELEVELNNTDDALKPVKAGELELLKKQISAVNTRIAEISQTPDYAIQEPSTTSQVPSVIEGGQNIQEGGEGVGQGIEGTQAPQEAPIQEPTAEIKSEEKVAPLNVYFDKTLEGKNKWVIDIQDEDLRNQYEEDGEDVLWRTKGDAVQAFNDWLKSKQEATQEVIPEEKVVTEAPEVDKEVERLESNLLSEEIAFENAQEEIENLKSELKDEKARIKQAIADVRKSNLSRAEKEDKIEDLKYKLEDFIDTHDSLVENNREDMQDAKKEIAKLNKKLKKMAEAPAQAAPTKAAGVSATNKSQLDDLKLRVTDAVKSGVVQTAERAINTLKSILPGFDIVIHENEDSYNNSVSGVGGQTNTRGNFSYSKNADGTYSGKIDINLNKANARTVAHEVAHAVLLKSFGENPKLFKTFRDKISKVLNSSRNAELIKFSNLYEGDVQAEEYLAELTAILEQQQDKLSPNVLQQIAAYINDLVSKLTNGAIKPFENVKDTKDIIDFFNTVSKSIREGAEISESDIKAIQEGASINIGSPTTITKSQKGEAIEFPDKPLPLSFVTGKDKVDIRALINEIVDKKQKVWFWMADQLGRGDYYDAVIDGKHYLDAGPSFALDPKNRKENILWASGVGRKALQDKINESDYIFFISGSPEKAKLFNRRVLDLVAERINVNSDFKSFKNAINSFGVETNDLKDIKSALDGINSFEELAKSPKRKPFLIAIDNIGKNKTMKPGSLKELLNGFDVFVDYNELRDGFYKENGFSQNDIMLVGKPTGLGGKAPHSTYENAIMGEVVGVPDVRMNSWDIIPQELRDKYKDVITGREEKTKPLQTKVIAAEIGQVRELNEKQPVSKSQKINWEVSKEGKGDPSISSRNNIVQQAAANLKAGKITNEEYRATVSENSPIGPITRFFEPATLQEIKNAFSVATKKESEAENIDKPVAEGEKVGLRLDIPSYKFNNTWVVSVHEGHTQSGKILSYTNVAKIKNVSFEPVPVAALNIAAGEKSKTSVARMYGEWENIQGNTMKQRGENAKKIVENIANDPNYVQVGMNPFRHSYFYDRSNDIGRPIMKADEVVQVGGLVYAKNPVYGNWTDEAFEVKGLFDSSGKVVKFQKVEGEEQAPQKGGPLARIKQSIDKSKAIKFEEAEVIPSEKGKANLYKSLNAPARSLNKLKELSQGAGSFFNKVKRAAIDTKYDIAKALTKSKTPIGDVARAAMRNAKGYTGASSLVIKLVNSQIFDRLSFAPNVKMKLIDDKGNTVNTVWSERQLFDAFLDANRIINIDARIRDKFSELVSLSRQLKNGIKNESLTKEEQDELVNQISQLKDYLLRRKSLDIKGPDGQVQMIGYQDPDFVYTDKLINLLKEDYAPIQYTHTDGKTQADAEGILSEIKEQLPELYKTFDKMSSDYYDNFRYLLDESLKNGLITKEVYDELWSYNYIPTKFIQHFIEGELAIDNPSKAKKLSASLKNLTGGSEEDVITNYQYIMELYAHATYRRIFDNRAAVKLAQALGKIDPNKFGKDSQFFIQKPNGKDKKGNPTYSDPEKGYDYIKFMVDGVENRIIAPKQFVDIWYDSEFQSSPWLDSTVNFFSKLTLVEFIKGVFTKYSPVFGVTQILLDAPQALISTKAYPDFFLGSVLLAKDYATVAKDVLSIVRDGKPTKFFVEAVQAGVFSDFLSTENDLIRGEKFTNYDGTDNIKNKVKYLVSRLNRGVDKTLETIAKVNEAVEYSTRLAVYYRMKQNLISKFKKDNNGAEPTGQDLENIQLLSAEQARNVVDFSVGGGVTKQANRLFAYLNSAIQVFVSAARGLKNNPWKAGLMMLEIGAAGAGLLAYSLGDLGGEDDEEKKKRYKEYRKRSTYEKESYFLMWTGNPERPFLRIPKPPLFKGLINLFEQAYLNASRGEEFNQEKMWSAFKRDIPFGSPLGELTRNPTINAMFKYGANYDYFRKENIVKDEEKILDYAETRGATELYKKIGKASKDLGFKEGISPKRLQEVVRSYTGDPTKNTWASLFDMGSKGSVALATGNTKELDEMFTGNPISDAFRNLGFEAKLFTKPIDYDASFAEELKEDEKEEYTKKYVIGNDVSEIRKNAKDYNTAIKSIIEYLKPLVNSKDINAEYADKILKAQPKLYSIKDAPYFYDDVFYANSNKNKAKILNHYISDMSISDGQKIVNDMANRGIITEDVVGMLNELRNK
jgi:hypothetical protein